jgi:Zn-dependent peptidase ImmA (M78 family)
MSVEMLKKIHAKINELRLEAASLLEWADVETENQFFRLNREEFGGPEGAARELRRLWQMPSGPVGNLTNMIEGAGGVVFRCDFETSAIDGVSQWPLDDSSMPPIFFINDVISGDRFRFTLAHELAHVVLHHLPTPDLEGEADRFASEFLMPAEEIKDSLKDLTIESAAELKSVWKVSIAALLRRARDLKTITEARYLTLVKRMSFLGDRKCEPIPIPQEEPALFDAIFSVNRNDIGRSDEELCEILAVVPETLAKRFGRGRTGLRLRFA